MKKPTIGRIVQYKLSASDAATINEKGAAHANQHYGGMILPMVVVRVWGDDCVNGQVIYDGHGTLWVTSRMKRNPENDWSEYQWDWPEIVQ